MLSFERKFQKAKSEPQSRSTTSGKVLEDNRSNKVVMRKANKTGLPDQLKSGIENLSGHSLDDVKVHYNSGKPSQLQAHAYAQGSDIHLASGQEKHLPHEAWHVVQQKQGRVKPTTEVNGVKVNDNTYLEKEADVMGGKALQLKAYNQSNIIQKNSNSSVTQLVREVKKTKRKTASDLIKEKEKRERLYLSKPWRRYDDLLEGVKKQVFKDKIEIAVIKGEVEDDEDIDLLDGFKKDIEGIKTEAIKVRSKIQNRRMGRTRSQDPEQKKLIRRLEGFKYELFLIMDHIKKLFPTHSGGFGAKGRAHDMEVKINPGVNPGGDVDNSFVNSFKLDGVQSNSMVYKKNKKVAKEKAKGVIVMGQAPAPSWHKQVRLVNLEKSLSKVNSPQTANYKGTPVGAPRGKGQYSSMGNTNATGYAYLLEVPGWKTQRWEWLHIRGAGLGGATNSTNLVTGTRDANTHMIPFESNIRVLASAIQYNSRYKELRVRWWVTGKKAPHAYTGIHIQWNLVRADAGAKPLEGEAHFNPLVTGSNISKTEVDHIEGALKTVREGIST